MSGNPVVSMLWALCLKLCIAIAYQIQWQASPLRWKQLWPSGLAIFLHVNFLMKQAHLCLVCLEYQYLNLILSVWTIKAYIRFGEINSILWNTYLHTREDIRGRRYFGVRIFENPCTKMQCTFTPVGGCLGVGALGWVKQHGENSW